MKIGLPKNNWWPPVIWLGPGGLLGLWYILGLAGALNELYIPRLEKVCSALIDLFTQKQIVKDIGVTCYRTASSFLLGAAGGISAGLLIGNSKKLARALEIVIEFFRALPSPALYPLFLLFFGVGETIKIAVAAFVIFWIVLKNTIHGVQQVSALRKKVARVFRATRFQMVRQVVYPDALPYIVAGMRTALSLSLILIVVGEMFLGGARGLGQKIFDTYASYRIADMYALILMIGILGYALDKIFFVWQRKKFHWVKSV